MTRDWRIWTVCAAALSMWLGGCSKDEPGPLNSPPPQIPPTPRTQIPAPASPSTPTPSASEQQPPKPTAVHPTETPAAPPKPLEPPKAMTPPADSKVATFAGLTGPKPATWIWQPATRQFSIAQYTVPGRDGADLAQLDVFKVGGSVEQNIERWKLTQFRNSDGSPVSPKITTFETDGMPVTLVEFSGEYKSMAAVNFAKDQVFLCAIVQAPAGQIFIRLVGPAGTVEPNRQDFMNLIQNLKKVDPEK